MKRLQSLETEKQQQEVGRAEKNKIQTPAVPWSRSTPSPDAPTALLVKRYLRPHPVYVGRKGFMVQLTLKRC